MDQFSPLEKQSDWQVSKPLLSSRLTLSTPDRGSIDLSITTNDLGIPVALELNSSKDELEHPLSMKISINCTRLGKKIAELCDSRQDSPSLNDLNHLLVSYKSDNPKIAAYQEQSIAANPLFYKVDAPDLSDSVLLRAEINRYPTLSDWIKQNAKHVIKLSRVDPNTNDLLASLEICSFKVGQNRTYVMISMAMSSPDLTESSKLSYKWENLASGDEERNVQSDIVLSVIDRFYHESLYDLSELYNKSKHTEARIRSLHREPNYDNSLEPFNYLSDAVLTTNALNSYPKITISSHQRIDANRVNFDIISSYGRPTELLSEFRSALSSPLSSYRKGALSQLNSASVSRAKVSYEYSLGSKILDLVNEIRQLPEFLAYELIRGTRYHPRADVIAEDLIEGNDLLCLKLKENYYEHLSNSRFCYHTLTVSGWDGGIKSLIFTDSKTDWDSGYSLIKFQEKYGSPAVVIQAPSGNLFSGTLNETRDYLRIQMKMFADNPFSLFEDHCKLGNQVIVDSPYKVSDDIISSLNILTTLINYERNTNQPALLNRNLFTLAYETIWKDNAHLVPIDPSAKLSLVLGINGQSLDFVRLARKSIFQEHVSGVTEGYYLKDVELSRPINCFRSDADTPETYRLIQKLNSALENATKPYLASSWYSMSYFEDALRRVIEE
jgi:hypothetical protein